MSSKAPTRPLEPTIRASTRTRRVVVAAAVVTALAGSIHLLLTAEHVEEGALFGAAFLAMGMYQTVLAGLLLFRPGPLAYRAGI